MIYQLKKIRKIIESIKDTGHFQQAFLHTSYLNELNLKKNINSEQSSENNPKTSYETLEFLGDSVLNFHTSLFIYRAFPKFAEGQMSKLKQLMVQESTLAHLSKEIGLGEFLQLGTGERKNGGADKESILADVFDQLQEYCQAQKNKIVYRLKRELRVEHQQLFIMEVSDGLGTFRESGKGRSKKEAEQQAAAKVIRKLGIGKKEESEN
ncbi:4987_t:CDS:2 [Entrophospora sp. SA101]|nr:4987_t:CDS:2 [Entrophospora sp. SA101]